MTLPTQNIIIVSTGGFALPKCSLVLDKICRHCLGRKLLLQTAHLTFKTGALLLKLGHLFFERLRLQAEHGIGGDVGNKFKDGFHGDNRMRSNSIIHPNSVGDIGLGFQGSLVNL